MEHTEVSENWHIFSDQHVSIGVTTFDGIDLFLRPGGVHSVGELRYRLSARLLQELAACAAAAHRHVIDQQADNLEEAPDA